MKSMKIEYYVKNVYENCKESEVKMFILKVVFFMNCLVLLVYIVGIVRIYCILLFWMFSSWEF